MQHLWIFFILVMFCLYVLIGLYLTDGIDSIVIIALTWLIYTIMVTTFINVFALGYFWSVIRNKKGPTGLRGQTGERGKIGLRGVCAMDTNEAYLMKALTHHIDDLYFGKKGKRIMNETTFVLPNNYINEKIATMAGSRQYKVIYTNLSKSDRPLINIINYLKEIITTWFNLIYNATTTNGSWFEDEYGDEDYTWSGNNPFDEIKKYDVYYWGVTRDFRPLKAEICRSTSTYQSSKFPIPNNELKPRLKILETNDYSWIGADQGSRLSGDGVFYRPKPVSIGEDTYHAVGDIIRENYSYNKPGQKASVGTDAMGYSTYYNNTGPAMRTVLVSGDVVDPVSYTLLSGVYRGWGKISTHALNCPSGYTSLGDIVGRWGSPNVNSDVNTINGAKCVPSECVEPINRGAVPIWNESFNFALNKEAYNPYAGADPNNAYNLFRTGGRPFYKIKDSCLTTKPNPPAKSITKDLDSSVADLGIGWYGHPYKLESKYSIFTFLNLVPEGIIVNKATGRRLYIIHYGGEEANIYIVLANDDNGEYTNAIQVDSDISKNSTKIRKISRLDARQQWKIIFSDLINNDKDKKHIELVNYSNNKMLYVGLDPHKGNAIYSTIGSSKTNSDVPFSGLSDQDKKNGFTFTFISSVGTNLNILDDEYSPETTKSN